MPTAIVYRSQSASHAAKRVAAAAPGLRAVQQDAYRPQPNEAVVRWDCYEPLLTNTHTVDINPATAVQGVRNKITARSILGALSPNTWTDLPSIQLPCVIRPKRHKAGAHFYVCRTAGEARAAAHRLRRVGWYASQLIQKVREFRVFVVKGRVVAVSERFPGNSHEIAWNLALGGRLANLDRADWPIAVLKAGVEGANRLGLGFAAMDVCLDTAGAAWVFEGNTSPALRNKFTIKQIAKGLAYSGDVPPVKTGASKPKSFAHPAILEGVPPVAERPLPVVAPMASPAAPPQVAVAVPVVPPIQAPQAPQGAAMPAMILSPLSTDTLTIAVRETKEGFLARAGVLFDKAVERERLNRRRDIENQIAELQRQLGAL